jgi:hypothetical protein
MFEILNDETNRSSPHQDLSKPHQLASVATNAFELTSSRHPTIHFSKNKTVSRRNVANNFRCFRRVFPDWGGESYRRFVHCQRVVKNFFRTLEDSVNGSYFTARTQVIGLTPIQTFVHLTRRRHVTVLTSKSVRSSQPIGKGVAKCNVRQRNHSLPPVQSQGPVPCQWQVTNEG